MEKKIEDRLKAPSKKMENGHMERWFLEQGAKNYVKSGMRICGIMLMGSIKNTAWWNDVNDVKKQMVKNGMLKEELLQKWEKYNLHKEKKSCNV